MGSTFSHWRCKWWLEADRVCVCLLFRVPVPWLGDDMDCVIKPLLVVVVAAAEEDTDGGGGSLVLAK